MISLIFFVQDPVLRMYGPIVTFPPLNARDHYYCKFYHFSFKPLFN
jgi:hypothetical protein